MKMTNDTKGNDPQLAFFFWLGADGEISNVSEEEFKEKQENWDGQRPSKQP